MTLAEDLATMAGFGADGAGVSRFAWTSELLDAQDWLIRELRALGLEADVDAAGNAIGRWGDGDGAVVVGSHLDTVPMGGRFDGALGVLAGLASLRALRERDAASGRPIWLVSFMDEEGARFRTPLFGSRAFTGADLSSLRGRTDADGVALEDAMAARGFSFDRLADARAVDGVAAYLELHIEQGRVLESAGADIGVVTGLAGLLGARVTFRGRSDHAGTTPMDDRRDALVGAARAIVALRALAASRPGLLRATVGAAEVSPGGFNVIPERVVFSIDVRIGDGHDVAEVERAIEALLSEAAEAEGLAHEIEVTHREPPVPFDPSIGDVLRAAADAEGAAYVDLVGGAGHDAMVLARHVPAGMLFVPSRDGVSHSPAEFTPDEACELGARVLARALRTLSAQTPERR